MPMEQNFVFTLFDVTQGIVEMETHDYTYTYFLDGAIVGKALKMTKYAHGRVLNYIKKHAWDVKKERKETTMATTEANKHVRRQRAVNDVEEYMREHGNFTLFKSGKSLRVFPAPCDCPQNRITGLLFFKWTKRNKRYKAFDRLILHVVCYKCRTKSQMIVIDPEGYDLKHKDYKQDAFLARHNLKPWQFKTN